MNQRALPLAGVKVVELGQLLDVSYTHLRAHETDS